MDFGDEAVVSRVVSEQGEREVEYERRVSGCCAKLGYQKLFYQSQHGLVEQRRVEGNHIAVVRLAGDERSFALQSFYSTKEIHEKGVRRFKAQYCTEEDNNSSRRRRRGYSIDSESTGAYYLNNWLSSEDYFCEKPPPEERTANLVYDLLDRRWGKALEAVAATPKAPYSAPLEYILNGFRSICSLLAEEDRQLVEHFMGRPTFEIVAMKMSSDSVGGSGSFINVFEEDARARFHEIRSIPRKVEILRTNFDYLVKFAGTYRPSVQDGYLQLAFRLLGNSCDQEGASLSQEHDYLRLLLRLDLRLSDRLNFAARLLGERRRRELCGELQERLCLFPRLENILYYTAAPVGRGRDERIELICREYLDEKLDLETVAGLALEFPSLRKYLLQFRQALQMAGEQGQLQRFQNCKWSLDSNNVREDDRRGRRAASFLECVNVAEERINEWKSSGEAPVVCDICCKKMLKEDSLLECGKCRHGGHIAHLAKWFEEYDNCPHIGCPCLCN